MHRSKVTMIFWLFTGFMLLACQPPGSRKGFYTSPLLAGDEVEILRTVTVPSGLARVYLQRGHTMSYGSTDQYAPFCYFRLRDPLPQAQEITPGTWVVDSVWLDETTVNVGRPLRLAASIGFGGIGGRTPIAYQFHIKLKSAQSGAMTLVCSGAFEEPLTAQPIRLPEVREALGDYAEVRVKDSQTAQ